MSYERRQIAIFTTASLPWLTGTAINPLFRAAYLAKCGKWKVSLVIPWLSSNDQDVVYPGKISFASPGEHERYVRRWLEDRTGFSSGFQIRFYPAKFSKDKRSILPVGDITEIIPDEDADVAVLEEPEHLTWYHHGRRWKIKFRKVIGIVHTNYLEYVKREKNGLVKAFFLKHINNWVTHIYCHRIIRLSAATQNLPRSIVCNVHGVNPKFLAIGKNKGSVAGGSLTMRAYYIGKMVWSKGYRELLQLLSNHQDQLSAIGLDLYGDGDDSDQVRKAAGKLKTDIRVFPGRDHADSLFNQYNVFVNPSTTDVVCTTTMEALAMGKIVVCTEHPSNEFFKGFPNCRMYSGGEEFVTMVQAALADGGKTPPLTEEEQRELSWEAATERFLVAAGLEEAAAAPVAAAGFMWVSGRMREMRRGVETAAAVAHQVISGNETARRAFGAIPGSLRPDEQQLKELSLLS